MRKISLKKCGCADYITLDRDGNLALYESGEFGYRVFYDVPRTELIKSKAFAKLPDNCVGGEIEFTVDAYGNQVDDSEVLLFFTLQVEDGFENGDFVVYPFDITKLIKDFKKNILTEKQNHTILYSMITEK